MISAIWPVHPHPLPDELLSSWMIRLAHANGFKVHNFCAEFFGRNRQIWNRDIDHCAPTWLTDALASRTGVSSERIAQTTLRSLESWVFEHFNEKAMTRWILPLGVFHRVRRGHGQQYCPLCLAQDKEPYLRRSWRLALSVICTQHKVFLNDRCHECGAPLAPHRADMIERQGFPERTSMSRCYRCRSKLTEFVVPANEEDVLLQELINQIAVAGHATLGMNRGIYSFMLFDGLRIIMHFDEKHSKDARHLGFEYLEADRRWELLKFSFSMLQNWPRILLNECANHSHAYTTLSMNQREIPYWLDSELRWHVFLGRALMSSVEASSISEAIQNKICGESVLKNTRLIAGRDISKFIPVLPTVSDDVADLLIASLDHEIGRASGMKQNLLLRDKVMLITGRCLKLRITELAAMTIFDISDKIDEEFSFWPRVDTVTSAHAMIRWYIKFIRSHMCHSKLTALFISLNGKPISPNGIGMRFVEAIEIGDLRRAIPSWIQWSGCKAKG